MKEVLQLFENIISKDLCSGCGTCAGVCGKGCISFRNDRHTPHIDADKCVNCGLCLKCCPGGKFEFLPLKSEDVKWNNKVGSYLSFLYCHSTDENLCKKGASGGTVSAIFKYLLEKGIVEKIYCARKDGETFSVFSTSHADDLDKTQGSKYIPIPMNIAIKTVLKEKKKVAIVGTPCQLQGWYKASARIKELNQYVLYKVGLFCGFVQPESALTAIRKYLKAEGEEWLFDGWRCGEYPGYVRFTNTHTGDTKQLLIYDALNIVVPFYSLEKCFMCPDGLNMCADISLGDVHSRGHNQNCSIIRTHRGAALVEDMINEGYLNAETISLEQALQSTVGSVAYLKGMRSRLYRKSKKKNIPQYDIDFGANEYKRVIILQNKIQIALYRFARLKGIIKFTEKHPDLQMSLGRYLYTFPSRSIVYKIISKVIKIIKRK